MANLIISLVFVGLAIYLMQKKFPITVVFLALALLIAVVYSVSTGLSPVATSSGSRVIDIFDIFRGQLIASFATVGLAMLPIFGYSVYMEKIRASVVLGSLVSKPVAMSRNPYFVGVLMAIIICGVMRTAIVSAFAIMALLFSTLYPAMLRAGLSAKTTMAAIFLGTCFDWGPADFVCAIVLGGAGHADVPDYFLKTSVLVVPFLLLITALISGFIMKACDNKDGYVLGTDAPKDDVSVGEIPPGFYAMLPLLPMVLIIIFSKAFFENVSISVLAAVFISLLVTFTVELLRKKQIRGRIDDLMSWFTGMGGGFTNLFIMVAAIQLFANTLSKLGGFAWAVSAILSTGVSGWAMFFIVGLFVIAMAVLIGEPSAITAIVAGPVAAAAAGLGIPLYAAIFPIQTANSFRCLSIGTGPHMQYCCKEANCAPIDIIKRTAIPCIVIFLGAFAASYFFLS